MTDAEPTTNEPTAAPEPTTPPAEAPTATAPPAEPETAQPQPQTQTRPPSRPTGEYLGTGRRKSSVARVRLRPGSGNIQVNKRTVEGYFTELQDRLDVLAPLELTGVRKQWDIVAKVHGGGHTGQAGALRLGLARALAQAHTDFEPTLRDAGYLTRDARRVERRSSPSG